MRPIIKTRDHSLGIEYVSPSLTLSKKDEINTKVFPSISFIRNCHWQFDQNKVKQWQLKFEQNFIEKGKFLLNMYFRI